MKNIGIDIGGTSIKAGIVDENGKITSKYTIDTQVEKGFDIISKNIVNMINELIKKDGSKIEEISTIGLGIPGVANEEGKVHFCTNLKWTNVELGKILRENFPNNKIIIENDATVAAVAEQAFGSIKGIQNAVLLTLGTGVGGGIIINGKKYSGHNGIGSELGHVIIGSDNFFDCSCGNNGCFETYCSATGVIKYAQKLISEGKKTSITDKVKTEEITAKIIFDEYKNQDPLAKEVVDRFVHYLSIGIANIVNAFAPEVIVLGGGLAYSYDLYIEQLYKEVGEKIIFKNLPFAKIVMATLGNDAGIVGAAMLK